MFGLQIYVGLIQTWFAYCLVFITRLVYMFSCVYFISGLYVAIHYVLFQVWFYA